MTSLSRQLKRLKTPQTSAHKERRGNVSFLYDFGDAKQFDYDTHYAIAITGLRELISLDPSIADFSHTLFNESYKTLDRGVQDERANTHLDNEIEKFLFKVVLNRFMLSATHKTIEWLIQRYQINEYNEEALIASVLPYHETLLFTRLIQTCVSPKINTSKWFWLKPIQLSGSPLPKSILIARCISNTGFIHSICDYTKKSLENNKKANFYAPFYASILINIIDKNTTENVITIIIDRVVDGLKSPLESYRNASYCVVAHLCCCVALQPTVLKRIFKAITKRSDSSNELLMALSIISSNQQIDALPKSILNIIETNHLIKISDFNIERLVCVVLKSLIFCINETNMKSKLRELLNGLPLSKLSIITCVQSIAKNIMEENSKVETTTYKETLSLIERRFPTLFDESLLEVDCISTIAPLLGAFKYSLVKDTGVPMIVGLKHYNESVRNATLQHIIENFDNLLLQSDESTLQQIKSVFADTFRYNTSQIIITMLGIKEKMFQIFTEKEMYEICGHLLKCCDSHQTRSDNESALYWYQLKNSVLATICCLPSPDKNTFFSLVYSYVFPVNDIDLNTVAIILDSKSAKSIEMLKHLRKKCHKLIDDSNEEKDLDNIVSKICYEFAKYFCNNSSDINIEKNITYFGDSIRKNIFNLLIVERIYALTSDSTIKQRIGNVLIEAIKRMNVTSFAKSKSKCELYDDFVHICVKYAKKGQIHITMIEFVFNSIINSVDSSIKSDVQNMMWYWFHQFHDNNFYMNLFKFLFDNSYNKHNKIYPLFQNLLLKFVKKLCVCVSIDFFAPFWSFNDNHLQQLRSLAVIVNFSDDYLDYNKATKLSLLIPLISQSSSVREMAIKVLNRVNEVNHDSIFKYVLRSAKHIESDENKINCVIAKIFDRTSSSSKHIKQTDYENLKCDCIEAIRSNDTPDNIKLNILLLLSNVNHQTISDLFAMDWFSNISFNNTTIKSRFIESLISFYSNNDIWSSIEANDIFMSFFIKTLNNEYSDYALNCLNKEQFESIVSQDTKILLLTQLLTLIVTNNNKLAKKKLKKLLFDGQIISILLDSLISNESNNLAKNAKRRRIVNERNFSLENKEWKMFMITLESIQSKKRVNNVSILTKSLLNYLKMTFFIDVKSSLEYLRQLLLQSLANIIKDDLNADLNSIQIEPIIDCLRESQQKETQRIALMLISSVSSKFKKDTFDYIMPIFTFIGTNLLHCDDQFTIQVISDVMESIIPSLLNGSKDLIINVFVDSLADIPAHRRLPLFSKLLSILGDDTHLSIVILKLVDKTLNKPKIERQLYFNIAISLFSDCAINVQLESLNQIMNSFCDYYINQKQNFTNRKIKLSDNELRIISHNLLHVVFNVIDCQEFAQSIANTKWLDVSKFLLNFLHNLIVINEKSNVLENEVKNTNNYNKRIRYYLHQVLIKLSSLLPNQQMLDLVIQLMKNDSALIKRRALEMLKEKLENFSDDNFNENQLKTLIEILITQLPTVKTVNKCDDSTIYNTQLSMITLKLISKHIFGNDSNQVMLNRIILQLIELIKAMKQQISVNFKASCILCLTQMMVILSYNAIPLLPTVVPIIIDNFVISDEVVVISYVTAISKLTQNFSKFLSSFLDKVIIKLFVVHSKFSQSIALKTKLKAIWLNMAKSITKSVLFSSLDSAYPHIYPLSVDSLYEFLIFAKISIENIDKTDIDSILKYYKNLMLKALDYRNDNREGLQEDIDKIENCCIDSFCTLIPKMNEVTFRPLFFKLNDWAVRENDGKCYQRMITFYKLSQFLADKLKDLFCKFIAPLIVTNGCQMLTYFHGNNKKSIKSLEYTIGHKLICSILETLYKCFMYDVNGEFLTKDRTQALMKPIIDQLTNTMGSDHDYKTRLEYVCLCTQYLINAKIDTGLVKDFNYQILLKTRENSSKVRYGALKTLHRLIITSGEEYLSLIPEVIPFIAELSEDDSNEIETMVKLIVTDLELILGEPISKYF